MPRGRKKVADAVAPELKPAEVKQTPTYAPTQYAQVVQEPVTVQRPLTRKRSFTWMWYVLVAVVALSLLFALYKGGEFVVRSLFTKTVSTEIDTKQLLIDLERLAVLPDEIPQVARVSDPEAVKSQSAFFNNVEAGDIVVAYLESKLIVIYRPSLGKIINMSSIAGQ